MPRRLTQEMKIDIGKMLLIKSWSIFVLRLIFCLIAKHHLSVIKERVVKSFLMWRWIQLAKRAGWNTDIELLILLVWIMLELSHVTLFELLSRMLRWTAWIFAPQIFKMRICKRLLSERYYIVCGPEFGINKGKKALTIRAIYGEKSAGRDYWLHLRSCMEFLGFEPCKADPDLWMRLATRADDTEYYKYVLLYVDDCLAISVEPKRIIENKIGKHFQMKDS